MCILVDDHNGETFKITFLDKSDPPASHLGSLDDVYVLQSESQTGGNEMFSQQTNTVEMKPDLCGNMTPENQQGDSEKLPGFFVCTV